VISMYGTSSGSKGGKSREGAVQSLLNSQETLNLTVLSGFLLGFTGT
jgi:hypothetical protein